MLASCLISSCRTVHLVVLFTPRPHERATKSSLTLLEIFSVAAILISGVTWHKVMSTWMLYGHFTSKAYYIATLREAVEAKR